MSTQKNSHINKQTSSLSQDPFTIARCSIADARRPTYNEDTILVDKQRGLIGIFDGVGGVRAAHSGQDCSRIAARMIHQQWQELQPEPALAATHTYDYATTLRNIIITTNNYLQDLVTQQETSVSGTTVVLAAITVNQDTNTTVPPITHRLRHLQSKYTLTYVHIGDSRLYLQRKGQNLARLTIDDNYFSLKVYDGSLTPEDALRIDQASHTDELTDIERTHFYRRNRITQSLGENDVSVHIGQIPLIAGDRVLFCTDGIHDNLTDQEIAHYLQKYARTTVARTLVRYAQKRSLQDRTTNIRAKQDDMSAVVLTIHES